MAQRKKATDLKAGDRIYFQGAHGMAQAQIGEQYAPEANGQILVFEATRTDGETVILRFGSTRTVIMAGGNK